MAANNFHELPNPHSSVSGVNTTDAGSQKPSRVAEKWRPAGTPITEPKVSTLSRFAGRLIDRLTGRAYSADELAPLSHTHPLSEISQSGATTGQVPTWNGSAWASDTVAFSLTSGPVTSSGSTSSIANNALSIAMMSGLQTALDSKQPTIPGPYATEDAARLDGVETYDPYLKTGGTVNWAVPFTPTDISGLQLWLDPSTLSYANGASVTSVPDLSGNSRTATPIGTAPTMETAGPNSQKWIVGNSTGIITPSFQQFPSKRGTWFFVYRPTSQSSSWLRTFGTNSGGTGVTWVWANNSNSISAELYFNAFTAGARRLMWDNAGDAVIMCLRRDGDTNMSVFRGSSKVDAITLADVQTDSNALRIGASLVGRMGEVFGYDTALTDSQVFAAMGYLTRKWGRSGVKPVNILFEGDSQTYGMGLGANTNSRIVEDSTWPHKLITNLGHPQNVTYHNLAVSGSRWAELTARAAATDARINPHATNIIVCWCGTNEGSINDASATHAAQAAYCAARRAAGWKKIVVGTAMDRSDQGTHAWRNSLNALIRANYTTYADGLIDVAADSRIGADNAYTDATYFNQSSPPHLNATGWQVVADLAAPIILQWIND